MRPFSGRETEKEKFITKQRPTAGKDDDNGENSWISQPSSSSRGRRRGEGRGEGRECREKGSAIETILRVH